jgi:hypothetical protein
VSDVGEQKPGIWRPLTVRGIPLHFVLPAAIGAVGLAMLITGGFVAVFGAWILTIGFSLSVGAFVADERALAVPAVIWAGWLAISALAGADSGLPRTPVLLAIVLAAMGAACVWLGQRAVQPAVEGARTAGRERALDTDIDALLAPVQAPEDSPSLDPAAEVDEALAALLLGEDDEVDAETEAEAIADGDASNDDADASEDGANDAEVPAAAAVDEDDELLDEGGHVIEFTALSEDDLLDDDAPLPAATEAGRRPDDAS